MLLYPGLVLREPAAFKDVGVDPDEVRESSSASSHKGLHPISAEDLREGGLF